MKSSRRLGGQILPFVGTLGLGAAIGVVIKADEIVLERDSSDKVNEKGGFTSKARTVLRISNNNKPSDSNLDGPPSVKEAMDMDNWIERFISHLENPIVFKLFVISIIVALAITFYLIKFKNIVNRLEDKVGFWYGLVLLLIINLISFSVTITIFQIFIIYQRFFF